MAEAGSDVGTNLIDGHVFSQWKGLSGFGSDVGTNLIDGHEFETTFRGVFKLVPMSAPT